MDPQTIKQQADRSLAGAHYDPRRLALLHTGAVVVLSLIVALINYLLNFGMDSAGGLSGVAVRSVFASAQTILSMASTFALPFWQIGFLYAALKYARGQQVGLPDLLEGFRLFGSVLRLTVLLLLVLIGVVFISANIASTLFMFSPASESVYLALEQMMEANVEALTTEQLLAIAPQLNWVIVLNFIVMLVLGLPIYYRFRLSEFSLMNGAPGALAAIRESAMLSRYRRMQLFKFDLSIWWYYAIQLLISLIASADMLLGLMGVTLPVNGTALYWVLFAVSSLANLLFTWRFGAWYQTAYAHCYLKLKDWEEHPPQSVVEIPE